MVFIKISCKKGILIFCGLIVFSLYSFKYRSISDIDLYNKKKIIFVKSPTVEDYLLGRFNYKKDTGFVKVETKYCSRDEMYLRKATAIAFKKMANAALKDGIKLTIISATRSFSEQKSIWEGKWEGKRLVNGKNLSTIKNPAERAITILKYSSMPGTSRHHWGTDIDLNSLSMSFFEKGEGQKIFTWLLKNASSFGFHQPYTPKGTERPMGYEEEKWHWSYTPVAKVYMQKFRTNCSNTEIKGFLGYETAVSLNVIKNYVLAVSKDCQ